MKTAFDAEWEEWIAHNLERGCNPVELFRILDKNDFDYELCKTRLGVELPEFDPKEHSFPSSRSQGAYLNGHFVDIPFADKIDVDECEIYRVGDFLSPEECEHLIALSEPLFRPSELVTYTPLVDPLFRTSLTADLESDSDPFVAEIDRRICALMGLNPSYSEGIQIQLYRVGAEFKAHHDYFTPGTKEYDVHAGPRGQRTWTMMVYLNDTPRGGETHFPEVDFTAYPHQGMAVIWNNLHENGRPNPASKHHGMPVLEGTKSVITKWFRSRGEGPAFLRTRNEYLPPLTREGFVMGQVPPGLLRALKEWMQRELPAIVVGTDRVEALKVPTELSQRLLSELRGLGELWTGVELEPLSVEAWIHRDGTVIPEYRGQFPRSGEGIQRVCALLPLSWDTEEDWPLSVEDHMYRRHRISLLTGSLVWLEEGRLLHGFPERLVGNHAALAIVHFHVETTNLLDEILDVNP